MNKYFYQAATGIKADIERHRKKEQELITTIKELEVMDQSDLMISTSLSTYRWLLYQLELSKAELVSKIGKNHSPKFDNKSQF